MMNSFKDKNLIISIHAIARISQRCIGYYLQTRRRFEKMDEDIVAWSKRIAADALKNDGDILRKKDRLIVRDRDLNFIFKVKTDRIVLITVF